MIVRLIIIYGIVFLIADTIPHPNLSKGLMLTGISRIQVHIFQEINPRDTN